MLEKYSLKTISTNLGQNIVQQVAFFNVAGYCVDYENNIYNKLEDFIYVNSIGFKKLIDNNDIVFDITIDKAFRVAGLDYSIVNPEYEIQLSTYLEEFKKIVQIKENVFEDKGFCFSNDGTKFKDWNDAKKYFLTSLKNNIESKNVVKDIDYNPQTMLN